MRTKSLLLAAGIAVAGVATSMAQSSNVFSVNVVGYINLTVRPGFNLIANQLSLSPTANTVQAILGTAAPQASLQDCQVLKYLKAQANYSIDYYDASGFSGPPGWYDNITGNPTTNIIDPGTGFFFYNSQGSNVTLTLAGSVPQGTNTVPLTTGFNLIGTVAPTQIPLDPTPTNNFPVIQDMQYLAFTNTGVGQPNYAVPDYYDLSGFSGPPGWYNNISGNPETPNPAVGQGYFIYTPSGTSWARYFKVN